MRQLRLLTDEVRRGVAAYGIAPSPGSSSRTAADGEPAVVSTVGVCTKVCVIYLIIIIFVYSISIFLFFI